MDYKITALKVQNRNQDRVNVYLDGSFSFGIAKVVAAWLRVGQVINEEKIAQLKNSDQREVALQKALHFLDYRPRSEKEVLRKLSEKGFNEAIINDTINRLKDTGLLGDEQFARVWVDNRVTFRPRSHRALAMELRQKGISDEIISTVLSDIADDEILGYEVAIKQARKYAGYEWCDFRNRLTGYLGRRGFHYSVIKPLVERVWTEINTDENDYIVNHQDKEYKDV